MAVNRGQLRATLRQRLDDTAASPLWSDATLNELLAGALRAYGRLVPRSASATTTFVAAGAASVALPAGVDAARCVALRLASGVEVPRAGVSVWPDPAEAGQPLMWGAWGASIRFTRKLKSGEAGVCTVDYLAAREPVEDDVTAWPVEAGHEGAVVAFAAQAAMLRRAADDYKRGLPTMAHELAAAFGDEARGLVAPPAPRLARGGVNARA